MNISLFFIKISKYFISYFVVKSFYSIYVFRVDGALFINLTDDEIPDLGISNKFHLRKLQLILKSYRTRYRLKKERLAQKRGDDDEDDLISEIAPSELSALIAAEDEENDYMSEGEESYEVLKTYNTILDYYHWMLIVYSIECKFGFRSR